MSPEVSLQWKGMESSAAGDFFVRSGPGSVRVSLEHASASFAFDPARAPLPTVLRAAQRKLADRGLILVPLRVMDRAARLKAPE